jgi:predicted transcriptional regulator
MTSTSVRISRQAHEALKEMAAREHRSLGDVLDEAIAQYRDRQFWLETREAYTRLREDPAAWQVFTDELAEWDATLMDGLDPDETFEDEPSDVS